ncbi:hypothetical protein [Massilia sp. Leaf139]|uniref:hypothetical protein n=1 Tax=Massilia sp. Leaf139 TaxID=1736272 RepID=UPI0006F74F8C|nr:hypothetical protein [Massilia sp. Leaf139]KQQ97126.1 hypothetical protein ASF77_03965 [Massilia sp. Leaf139]
MRPLPLLLSALLLPCVAFAQTDSSALPDPVSTVQVTAPVKTMRIQPDQAKDLIGSYAMSNGWTMKVRPSSRFIDAAIDERQPIRLVQVAPYRFVSSDGNVTMNFKEGDGEDMTMSYVPDRRLAQVVVVRARMAQR